MKNNLSTTRFIEHGRRVRGSSRHTTEDAYPKIFPVNSMHASAPRCTLWSAMVGFWGDGATYMVGRRNLALVDRHNCPRQASFLDYQRGNHVSDTHDSNPTPNPEINLPTTILGMPPVKV